MREAALVEPFSVALHAVENAGVGVGDTVVIIGDGSLGLFTAAGCRIAGASRGDPCGASQFQTEACAGDWGDRCVPTPMTEAFQNGFFRMSVKRTCALNASAGPIA